MAEQRTYDEAILLRRLAAGDELALEEIYKSLWQKLFMAAYNILRNKTACEDIVQDIFLQLWAKRSTLQINESVEAYLYSAVRYQVFRYIRNNPCVNHFFEDVEERTAEVSPEMMFRQKEIAEIVNQTVSQLPEKCRAVYKLSREEQLSHKEIAQLLHISTKTVENHLTIALRKLRTSLGRFAGFFLF
ncbi:MAG: RNA polymerase sigma-70 factor [Bacteroidetes bacterium]|nr:RNA polymerase sigma-70 factor [Bacteroidota bacterium]MBS1933601.1 RNA polymerase sigma-70 factor [Bacteroidota bacterium]